MLRQVVPERLDADAGTPAEVRRSLDDLRLINTLFGGVTSTTKLIREVAEGAQHFTLLEVASGTGYVPQAANDWLSSDGITLDIALLDRAPSHLPNNGIPTHIGDALQLPFADNSYDLVSCNLFFHHLTAEEAVLFANESLRVAKKAVLISDLIRSRLHLILAHISLPLYRSPITWHDAPASIRAAYTPNEVRQILSQSHARKIEIERHYLYRMGIILWK